MNKWDWSVNDTQVVIIIWISIMFGIAGEHFGWFMGGIAFLYLLAVIGQNLT